jgi:tRNA threonylcarbamoyladenosine biosynthesis protein TsaE
MKYLIKTEKDLEKLAQDALLLITENKYNHATVLALQGELGSGKTTFTKQLAKILDITDSVTSPTFVIQKTFEIKNEKIQKENFLKKMIHIDSYRLDLSQELLHLGWKEELSEKENLIVVEWPERISEILPQQYILLKFSHVDETTREVEIINV